jgi:hypothetical protein
MALRLPLMGLRKAKALSRDAGSVQKIRRTKKAGFCHALKHETAVAKNVIWSSTLSRSRRKGAILRAKRTPLADFIDGRPFDPIER